ncbi:MAG: hypothetical protein JXM73_08100 [Anaerolineae bacterium]|nr:hypothetical protein [Anaerolineae bacterium]
MKRRDGKANRIIWLGVVWCWMSVLLLLLAFLGACPGSAKECETWYDPLSTAPQGVLADVADWDNYPLKFVGKDHVDLKWQLYLEHPTYRIYRDGIQIAECGRETTFHRDTGVFEGQMPTYKVCAIEAG